MIPHRQADKSCLLADLRDGHRSGLDRIDDGLPAEHVIYPLGLRLALGLALQFCDGKC